MVEILKKNNIRLIVSDFDGVMTDNRVLVDEEGHEAVFVNRSDGLGIRMLKEQGIDVVILSTEENLVVTARARKLKIDCFQGIDNKCEAMSMIAEKYETPFSQIAYIGNDINDIEAMKMAKVKIAPNDAYEEIKDIADYVLEVDGGYGVIREIAQ